MNFHEFGSSTNPHIMLIHGGGNAWWNYLRQAKALMDRYHVILPTLDGHGEESALPYHSTEEEAQALLDYIDRCCGGHLFALGGVSLGGQIVMELLAQRPDVAQKVIIDGSTCYPQPGMARFSIAVVRLCGWMLFSRWSCRAQMAMMRFLPEKMRFPDEIARYYLQDMPRVRRETLYAMYRSYMMHYTLKESVALTSAEVMYWYGEKEMRCVKESAQQFRALVPSCRIYEAKGCNHGYLAVYLPEEWLAVALPFLEAP